MKTHCLVSEDVDYSRNEVLLHGRVSGAAMEKTLPSGDVVCEFRLIVRRSGHSGVDTLDIAVWNARSRRTALCLKSDEWVEITGAVHRRFWQASGGLASRWQVEASTVRRI